MICALCGNDKAGEVEHWEMMITDNGLAPEIDLCKNQFACWERRKGEGMKTRDLHFFINAIRQRIETERTQTLAHGWQFKERTPIHHFIRDFIGAVMVIDNEVDAGRFFRGYVEFHTKYYPSADVGKIVPSNIGWCFGEGMTPERIAMWVKVCGASHPIFGQTMPSAEEALQAGIKEAEHAQATEVS